MGMMMMSPGQQMPMSQVPSQQGGMMNSSASGNAQLYSQMADVIIQNPSPQTVMRVIDVLQNINDAGIGETIQELSRIANDPNALIQFAQQVKQHYGG